METPKYTNIAACIHLSALTQYLMPFGNFIFPIVLWISKKEQSEFVDQNGKQLLNFQLSIFLYSLLMLLIAIPCLVYTFLNNITLTDFINNANHNDFLLNFDFSNSVALLTMAAVSIIVVGFLKVAEFFLIIQASVKASNGEDYNYPITIPFLK